MVTYLQLWYGHIARLGAIQDIKDVPESFPDLSNTLLPAFLHVFMCLVPDILITMVPGSIAT